MTMCRFSTKPLKGPAPDTEAVSRQQIRLARRAKARRTAARTSPFGVDRIAADEVDFFSKRVGSSHLTARRRWFKMTSEDLRSGLSHAAAPWRLGVATHERGVLWLVCVGSVC